LKECRFLEPRPEPGSQGVSIYLIRLKTSTLNLDGQIKSLIKNYSQGSNQKLLTKIGYTDRMVDSFGHETLRYELQRFHQTYATGFKIAILQLERPDRTAYNSFKDMTDRQFGIQSICITKEKALSGEVLQYLGNVSMKINIKCTGINHSAGDPVDKFNESLQQKLKDTMILGADVTHPSMASIEGCPSIAAIVGSVDVHGGKFLGSMRLQSTERTDREVSDTSNLARALRSTDLHRSSKT
jgi:hypothetical protein